MKTYTWQNGNLFNGLALVADERLGQIVFLGENGRGRHYEKVGLAKNNPAEVSNGRVFEANPVKITLPAKEDKPEKRFYVIAKPVVPQNDGAVLVRICTYTAYIRGGRGCWQTVEGSPETIVSGYGAFGDAGRIGTWSDGLVKMKPGDVLKVYPSRGVESALWIGKDGKPVTTTWQDYENISSVEKVQAIISMVEKSQTQETDNETKEEPKNALEIVHGQMQAFSFAGGKITNGLEIVTGATGKVVTLGEYGRGRSQVELPIVGMPDTDRLESASIVKLDEKITPSTYSWEQPKVKTIYGLTKSEQPAEGLLVRISTSGPYTKGTIGKTEQWRGQTTVIITGSGAHGDAGRVGGWEDVLVVMRECDVLKVTAEGGYKSSGPWALFVKNGQLTVENWHEWKLADAKNDPDFYIAKGIAPTVNTPIEWVGRIVTSQYLTKNQTGCGPKKTYMEDRVTGELIRIEKNGVILNLGWDGKDYHERLVNDEWVKLEMDKRLHKLDGEEAEKRLLIREKAEELKNRAIKITKESHFPTAELNLREAVQAITKGAEFDTMPTEGWDSISSWVEKATHVIERWTCAEAELKALFERKNSGEVLVDFGGHFRVMGKTGNAQYWVLKPDGTEREADEIEYRKRYTAEGHKKWRLVNSDELAISWFKRDTGSAHEFVINKLPADGCTPEQISTIKRLESEIAPLFDGAVGMSGAESPGIGNGWNIGKQDEKSKSTSETNGRKLNESELKDGLMALQSKFRNGR